MSNRAKLTGAKFGKLIVLGRGEDYISPSGSHLLRWKCQCECGNTINATTSQLKRGLSSCGCVSRREDLTGRRFGKLVVQYAVDDYVSPKGSHMSKWHCKCDCGNEIDIIGMSLKNGDTSSCGYCKRSRQLRESVVIDYSGQTFGDLYVIRKIPDSHPPKYICKCSCGREVEVFQKNLTSGKKTHCGCKTVRQKFTRPDIKAKEYVGKRIGKLTVIEELKPHITPNGSKQRIVKCQCDCGNVFTIRLASAVKNQKCKECLDKERRIDITGKRFGKLVVLSMADDYISPSGHRLSRCICQCDCGNVTIVNMSGLVTGSTQSCGCLQNTAGLLKDNRELVAKYDFDKNKEIGSDFEKLTARSSLKAWWKCNECGNSWFATIASQNDKVEHGCPYCSGRLVIKGKTDLQTLFPEIAREWDYEKNGDLSPSDISSKSSLKVWWKCNEGHEWKATVGNRTHNNSGCPRCNLENVNSFCEQAVYFYVRRAFPDAINGDHHLDIELDIFIPSLHYAIEYDGEAWHHSEKRKANDENKNRLCADAGIKLIRIREPKLPEVDDCIIIHRSDSTRSESLNNAIHELLVLLGVSSIDVDTDKDSSLILDQFATKKYENSLAYCYPDAASEWHPIKNGNMTPDRISKASSRVVWWLGKCGHEWQAIVSERTMPTRSRKEGGGRKAYGCPYCSGKRILIGFNDLQTKYPGIAEEWHPVKNGDLKPTDITPGSNKKVWWLGKCGHEWQSSPNKRCNDNRQCPICYKEKRSPAVICIETGQVFQSGIEAAKALGYDSASHIYKCCRNKANIAYGYHWKFKDEEDQSIN